MARNHVSLAGLLLAVAGCMSVRSVQPAQYIPAHHPLIVWVTYNDDSYVPVAQPHIVGDSLQGTWQGLQEPISIPLNHIQTVQARMPDHKRTVIFFTTMALVSGAVAYTVATAGNGGKPNACGFDKNGQPLMYCDDNL